MKTTYFALWFVSGLYWLAMAMNVVFRFLAACESTFCKLSAKTVRYLFIPGLAIPLLLGLIFLSRLIFGWFNRESLSKVEISLALGTAALFLFSMANFPTS